MIERAYIIKIEKTITDYLEHKYAVLLKVIKKLIDEEE